MEELDYIQALENSMEELELEIKRLKRIIDESKK